MDNEDVDCGCMSRRRRISEKTNRNTIQMPGPLTLPLGPVAGSDYFYGKTVLITGATGSIGHNLAKNFHFLGAKVIACARTDNDLEKLRSDLPGIHPLIIDLNKWANTDRKLRQVGNMDFLINCAGTFSLGSILSSTEEQFDDVFNLNIKGLVNVTRTFAELLIKRKGQGSIVSITSQTSTSGMKKQGIFGASKAAVEAFTRAAAIEFGPHGIRVNCVSPVIVVTKYTKTAWSKTKDHALLAKIPMKRFAEVHEVVQAIIFLLGDKSSMITGCTLPVDGGFSAC